MTRRERRERERAAAEAAERARTTGPPQAAGPPQTGGAQQPGGTPPAAGPQPPSSPRPAAESWSPRPAQPQQSSWHSSPQTSPQPGSGRPVIRSASRTTARTGSGPVHQVAAHTQQMPAPPTGPGHTGSGPGHTGSAVGAGTAQSVFAASASPQAAHGSPSPAGGQTAGSPAAASAAGERRAHRKRQTEYEPLGPVRGTIRAFGELCITAGMVLILFVVWQLWWTDIAANKDNEVLADQLITEWRDNPDNELPDDPDTPFVAEPVDENSGFGIMYVPRFGEDYYRTVAEGVSMEPVLNRMGVGRYPSSAMPGEVGNFAIAGHRVTYGKPLNQIHQLRPGDEIIVQTADGYYTYTFRNFEIVLPDATEVLSAVPMMPEYKGKDRIMTLTACNPMFSARERFVAYAELTDWAPVGDGAPDSIADSPAYDKVGGDA